MTQVSRNKTRRSPLKFYSSTGGRRIARSPVEKRKKNKCVLARGQATRMQCHQLLTNWHRGVRCHGLPLNGRMSDVRRPPLCIWRRLPYPGTHADAFIYLCAHLLAKNHYILGAAFDLCQRVQCLRPGATLAYWHTYGRAKEAKGRGASLRQASRLSLSHALCLISYAQGDWDKVVEWPWCSTLSSLATREMNQTMRQCKINTIHGWIWWSEVILPSG